MKWLLPFDEQAKRVVREIVAQDRQIMAEELWRLAHYDMPLTASQKLVRKFRNEKGPLPDDFRKVSVGLLGADTLDYLAEGLAGSGLKHGLILEGRARTIATALPMIHSGSDPFDGEKVDFVAILPSLARVSDMLGPDIVEDISDVLMADISTMAKWVQREKKATPVLGLPPWGVVELVNSNDLMIPWTETAIRQNMHLRMCQLALENSWPIWNVDHLANTIGLDSWLSDKQYYWAKLPFDLELVMRVADSLGRIVAAATGKTRRVLVLDLDNTLWGGVVGDDGVEGLLVGEGDGAGEAHLALQKVALALKKRGVALAVCSKNDDVVARSPFRALRDMALTEADIAIFQANWEDKATNLKAIASAMNLTTSSLAFLDDNPAERSRVRQMIPDVAVIEPGEEISEFPRRVIASGYFEHLNLTREDLRRAKDYKNAGRRAEILSNAVNYDEYLTSLEMKLFIAPFDSAGRQRIAQLINKSNQFNLTTRRYSVQEVEAIETASDRIGLQFRLADKFGDSGMISVIVLDIEDSRTWEIDTWLMSCRVLKRGVEQAVLNEIVRLAKAAGVATLRGLYLPTSKNGMVAGHYAGLGFTDVTEKSPGLLSEATVWELDLSGCEPLHVFMAVERAA